MTDQKIDELLSQNKQELIDTKNKIISEINEHIKYYFEEGNFELMLNIRQFINEKQSYFSSGLFHYPALKLNGFDISKLNSDTKRTILIAYQNAIKINEELHNESEKIYSDLSDLFVSKLSKSDK